MSLRTRLTGAEQVAHIRATKGFGLANAGHARSTGQADARHHVASNVFNVSMPSDSSPSSQPGDTPGEVQLFLVVNMYPRPPCMYVDLSFSRASIP